MRPHEQRNCCGQQATPGSRPHGPDPRDPGKAHTRCHSRTTTMTGRSAHRKTVSPELRIRQRPPTAVHPSLHHLQAERLSRDRLLTLHRLATGCHHHCRQWRWQRPGMPHLGSFCRGPEPSESLPRSVLGRGGEGGDVGRGGAPSRQRALVVLGDIFAIWRLLADDSD
jgi:hypothetical protein